MGTRLLARLLAALVLVAGCAPAPVIPPNAPGDPIATAAQASGPVLWPLPDGYAAAWVGESAAGVHLDARIVSRGTPGPVVTLPLPPTHPFALGASSGAGGRLFLFWLDAHPDGGSRLYVALLDRSLAVLRGPTAVSTAPTYAYALAADRGGVWTAWSGDLAAEPSLYVQRVDADGRAMPPARAATNAEHPALLASADAAGVFWTDRATGTVYRGWWDGTALRDTVSVAAGPRLEPGDRVEAFHAGGDPQAAMLVWNVVRVNGAAETLVVFGSEEGPAPAPRIVIVDDEPVRWAAPFAGSGSARALVGQRGATLGLLTLQGEPSGVFDALVPLRADLLGSPGAYAAGDTRYVTWAEPRDDGMAALRALALPARDEPEAAD